MADDSISELFRIAAESWVDADAAATLLEDTKSAFLSQQMQDYLEGGMAVNRAEQTVKGSKVWADYVTKTVNARKHANLHRVQMDYLRMKFFEQNSSEATRRQEMRL